jgi:serine/threonine protein kinase
MLRPSPFLEPPFRGEIAAEYDRPEIRELLSGLDVRLAGPDAEVLHRGRNTVTALHIAAADGIIYEIAVKEFRLRGLGRLKTLLVASKGRRAWNGARALLEAGLSTAAPIAYGEVRRRGVVDRVVFLAERLTEGTEIRAFFRDRPPDALRPVLAGLARAVRSGHDRGVIHRDLSDGNVLVAGGEGGEFRFYFLDTNRVRRKRRVGGFARAKNLIRLGAPPDLRRDFLKSYAGEAGLRPSFVFFYARTKAFFEGWLRFKKKARLRRWARRLKIQ